MARVPSGVSLFFLSFLFFSGRVVVLSVPAPLFWRAAVGFFFYRPFLPLQVCLLLCVCVSCIKVQDDVHGDCIAPRGVREQTEKKNKHFSYIYGTIFIQLNLKTTRKYIIPI